MPIWKITPEGPAKVDETQLEQEELLERHLEDWLVADPSLFGEPLLVIGRQVVIPDVRDQLDLLALDPEGNAVVIELKRGKLKDPVDMQALRYASYISKWQFEDFEKEATAYLEARSDPDFNFNELYEEFCREAGVDEAPDLNSDQRLILVGSEVRDKLGSVALWLHDHNIDIKVIEIEAYRQDEVILVQPRVIIPLPVSRFLDTGRAPRGEVSRPWKTDGKSWHLDRRCSASTRAMLLKLNDLIRDNLEVDGPRWNQKFYVSYRVDSGIWLAVVTRTGALNLNFVVSASAFDQADLASRLSVEQFVREDSLADKFGLPSSVLIRKRGESTDRVTLRIKEDFHLKSQAFVEFLQEAHEAFPR